MIKIENTEARGFEAAIRGMRNPKNSWDKSDSYQCHIGETGECSCCENRHTGACINGYVLSPSDHKLMMALANGGPVHAKYRRFIDVTVDITAPLYWWKEFKTYRKGREFLNDEELPFDGDRNDDRFMDAQDFVEPFVEMNSCSTMHKIQAKEFTIDDFSHEHLFDIPSYNCEMSELPEYNGEVWDSVLMLELIVKMLNHYRDNFLETGDRRYWWQMIQLLPSSYMQKRTVKLSYEVLHEMYTWRNHHKLDEWPAFCDWIRSLPASGIITGRVDS